MQKPLAKTDQSPDPLARDLDQLARWMDSVFRIPGLGLRFGLDVILGLIPGAGDIATSLVSIYIFTAANRIGVPRITLVRMALNIIIDLVVGAVPFVGDAFDVYWKSNQRNVELLRRHVEANPTAARKLRTADRLFVVALAIIVLVFVAASTVVAFFIAKWAIEELGRLATRSPS
jgi:hypothetical protein